MLAIILILKKTFKSQSNDIPQLGCTDMKTDNFNSNANIDDGSCYFPMNCIDPYASNYDENANIDDGS